MSLSSLIPRLRSLSLLTPKPTKTPTLRFTTSALAGTLHTQLLKNPNNPENGLNSIKPKLDPGCVHEVMTRFSLDNSPQLGLRFFVWAGLQAQYRHSSYMYSKACDLLGVRRNPRIVLDLIEAYRVNNCVVGVKMFKVVLSLCKEGRLPNEALLVMRKMREFGLRPDTNVYNVVVSLFCEDGNMDMGRELLEEMEVDGLYPDMVTYVLLIKGFSNAGKLEEACGLLKSMKDHGCAPNVVVYTTILDGFIKFGKLEKAMELLEEMENSDGPCRPNVITYTSVIQSLCGKSRAMDALKVLERMEVWGRAPNRVTASTLIQGLCVADSLEEAYKLINRVVAQGGVSYRDCYSSLVVSLIRLKKAKEAEIAFNSALAAGVELDGLACSMMIKELCSEKKVLDGFQVLDEIEKSEWLSTLDSDIYSDLLVGLCHGTHTLEAGKLARLMLQKKIRLEASHVAEVVKHLKQFGEEEIATRLALQKI